MVGVSGFLKPPGPTPLWEPGGVPGEWSDVFGFLKPPGSENEWQVRMHGALTIPFGMLGLKETDQSCHHEVWIHLLHVNARLVDRISRDDKSRRPSSKKRNSPHDHSKERRQNRQNVTIHVKGTCHPCGHSWLPRAAVSAFS